MRYARVGRPLEGHWRPGVCPWVLMLGATASFLRLARDCLGAGRAFSRRLFAVSGLMVHYGAFATYDALGSFLLTLSLSTPASVVSRSFAMTGVLVLPAALAPIVRAARWNPPDT
jgi:hypothetical protein